MNSGYFFSRYLDRSVEFKQVALYNTIKDLQSQYKQPFLNTLLSNIWLLVRQRFHYVKEKHLDFHITEDDLGNSIVMNKYCSH